MGAKHRLVPLQDGVKGDGNISSTVSSMSFISTLFRAANFRSLELPSAVASDWRTSPEHDVTTSQWQHRRADSTAEALKLNIT